MAKANQSRRQGSIGLTGQTWLEQQSLSISFSKSINLRLKEIRAKTVKCEAVNGVRTFIERKTMICTIDKNNFTLAQWSSDFRPPISGRFKFCKRYGQRFPDAFVKVEQIQRNDPQKCVHKTIILRAAEVTQREI
ncbi:hypothetical protein ACTXT7_016415 [Hymenolepis weldensis]